ncbi:bifunctional ADP-dependent NAD(P)H-hydrate dehydratase/NAD(P)H-hydrate epimerase [Candidatus Aerophobetes bacterium]|uniref:Bifunctional NAD(P)H-hydrate repair enzyme n=1 Tax=Aerophobetes bacterium TaxID=2030807 RepID=A0A662CZW6_UNCAE|nr:MAG: bifunctional ADP-dependent NAD(P)H-hydrate dehydratase/NAD(P)H-hydrate epimerase [Candidatus Aerophobetes bacterium]
MKVSSVSEMRNLDRRAIEEFDIPQEILMENAGEAVYLAILREFGIKGKKFIICCGTGNNGGDGLVVARKIHSNGGEVKVLFLGDKSRMRGAAKRNLDIISRMPVETCEVKSPESVKPLILYSDAIIDAIFGTGLTRDVEGIYRDVIELINESGKKVFSVDIPSGINGDTGGVMGIAVKADCTITFGLPKVGNIIYPGYEHCGKLYISHISFPPSLYNSDSIKIQINSLVELPKREKDTHKGSYGKALFIAGSSNYLGAPYFSALSFLKAGGGLSYLAAPRSISPFLANKGSEVVFVPQEETHSGSIALRNEDELLELSEKVDMVIMGPGLSLNEETQKLVRRLTKEIKRPLLIDGDGITAIAQDTQIVKERENVTILTPHLGEMAKVTGIKIEKINKNKMEVLRKTTGELKAIIVLKGAHSLIGYPDGKVYVNMSGNPGMATAGSGDVLTGTIAAMFGLGLSIEEAVRMGVFIHGFSGDLAAKDKGEDGITAQDILDYLPLAVKHYREEFDELSRDIYGSVHVI